MRPSFLALALAASLTGCSAQSLASLYCGGPPPTSNNPVVPQLLFPVPGYSSVPDNAPTLVVAYSLSPNGAFPIIITPKGGSAIQLGAMKSPPKPLPQPLAQELVKGTPMYGLALPALAPKTTYSVAYKDIVTYCGRTFINDYNMGTFKTI